MKHQNDIYKKPQKPLSEYFSFVTIATLIATFLIFETYTVLFEPSWNSLDFNQSAQCEHVDQENNIKLALNTTPTAENNPISDVKPKEIVIVSKTVVPKKLIVEPISAAKVIENPTKEIILLADENQSWILQSSYSAYTLDDKVSLLNHAIKYNHTSNLSKMLDRGYRFKTPYYPGNANKLIFTRHYEVTILLINHDLLDLKKTNKYGYTLLHEATAKGHRALIRLMVAKGIDINIQANDGTSVLHYPSHLGYANTVKNLLALGINPNLTATLKYPGLYWNQSTPLHVASKRGHIKLIKLLFENRADITLKDGDGLTALDLARKFKREKVVAYLESKLPKTLKTAPVLDVNSSKKVTSSAAIPSSSSNQSLPNDTRDILEIQPTSDLNMSQNIKESNKTL